MSSVRHSFSILRHCATRAERFVMFHDIRWKIKDARIPYAAPLSLFQSKFLCDVIAPVVSCRSEVELRWMGKHFPHDSFDDRTVEWRLAKWNLLFVFGVLEKNKNWISSRSDVSQGCSRFFELLLLLLLLSSSFASPNPFVETSGVNVRAPFMMLL